MHVAEDLDDRRIELLPGAAVQLVEREAGLGQDRVGDRYLAEVVPLAGLPEQVELVACETQALADRCDEIADAVQVVVQLGLSLVQSLGQRAPYSARPRNT